MEITTLELILLVITFGIMTFFSVWPSRKPKSVIDIEVEILDNTKNTIPYTLVEELGFEEVEDKNKDFWRKQLSLNSYITVEIYNINSYYLKLIVNNEVVETLKIYNNENIYIAYRLLVNKIF
jgi:hypothetical protein